MWSLILYCPWTDKFPCVAQKLCWEYYLDSANAPLYDKECRQTPTLFLAKKERLPLACIKFTVCMTLLIKCSILKTTTQHFLMHDAAICCQVTRTILLLHLYLRPPHGPTFFTTHRRCSMCCKFDKFVPGQFHVITLWRMFSKMFFMSSRTSI